MTVPAGVDPGVWEAGRARARAALALRPTRRECDTPRCKQPVTDISGLCPRHIRRAAERAADVNARHGAPR